MIQQQSSNFDDRPQELGKFQQLEAHLTTLHTNGDITSDDLFITDNDGQHGSDFWSQNAQGLTSRKDTNYIEESDYYIMDNSPCKAESVHDCDYEKVGTRKGGRRSREI